MKTTGTTALMLADYLEEEPLDSTGKRIVEELRRLHARNQELEAMLEAVGAGGVSAQRVTQAADHIAQPRKMVAAQEPFGYFKAEPFGWRDCAETEEGAIALYEAPQPQADARDAAFEAARKKFCKLQRYSFITGTGGCVQRIIDRGGNWVEFDAAHELFDPVAVDAAIAASKESK